MTVSAAVSAAVFGQTVVLSGAVPLKKQGEVVTIFAQEFGKGSPRLIGTVGTDAIGRVELRRQADHPDLVPRELAGRGEPALPSSASGPRSRSVVRAATAS